MLREGRFVLVLPTAGKSAEPREPTGPGAAERRKRLVLTHRANDGDTTAREAVLVRPDGYYAWAGAADTTVIEAGITPWVG